MKTLDEWLAEYAQSHRNRINRRIHIVCVPLILWSVVGFFSLVRVPQYSENIGLSMATLLSLLSLVFYLRLGLKPFFQMLLLLAICLAFCVLAEAAVRPVWPLYAGVFLLAWIGQAIGHFFEGQKPSFFKDVQFLLIGPLWIFNRHA